MNILLTGSSGFIGSEIKFQILKRGHTIRSIYDNSPGEGVASIMGNAKL